VGAGLQTQLSIRYITDTTLAGFPPITMEIYGGLTNYAVSDRFEKRSTSIDMKVFFAGTPGSYVTACFTASDDDEQFKCLAQHDARSIDYPYFRLRSDFSTKQAIFIECSW